MLVPARAMVLAFSLRLSRMAPTCSMWLLLALRLPVMPPTLPSPMLGLGLVSATDVVSVLEGEKGIVRGAEGEKGRRRERCSEQTQRGSLQVVKYRLRLSGKCGGKAHLNILILY